MTNNIYDPEIAGNEFLYKYMKFDENFIKTLINNELWFSNPLKGFNDPYDFQLGIETDATKEELLHYLQHRNRVFSDELRDLIRNDKIKNAIQLLKERNVRDDYIKDRLLNVKNGQDFDSKKIIEERTDYFLNRTDQFKQEMNNHLQIAIKDFRVLCLTKKENNILMWAHYSDNHKGVRIKLKVKKGDYFHKHALIVNYPSQYPRYNYVKLIDNLSSGKLIKHIAGNKSQEWEYESEIRIILNTSDNFRNNGLKKFNKEKLVEIAFGINASPSDIELTKNIISKYYENKVTIKKAEKIDNSFVPELRLVN